MFNLMNTEKEFNLGSKKLLTSVDKRLYGMNNNHLRNLMKTKPVFDKLPLFDIQGIHADVKKDENLSNK